MVYYIEKMAVIGIFGIGSFIKKNLKMKKYKRNNMYIHDSAIIGKEVNLYSDISIGKLSYIGSGTIYSKCRIGSFCSVSVNVVIGADSHPINWLSTNPFQYSNMFNVNFNSKLSYIDQKEITIVGNDVWIGANAVIKSGITVGDGAIIGAGAVVTKDVPPYAIVVGVPAKILRYRFDEKTIKELLELKWWEKDIDELKTLQFNNVKDCIGKLNT